MKAADATLGYEPRAEQRIVRTITAVSGVAALLLFVLALGPMVDETPYLTLSYAIGAPILIFGGYGVLVILTFRLKLRDIRRANGWYALLFLFVVLTWLPSMGAMPLPEDVNPWVLEIVTIGAIPAAIAWRAPFAWAYLLVNSIIVAPIRYLAAGQTDWAVPLQYSLLTLTLGSIFTALAMAAIHNAKAVDLASTMVRDAAARSAAASARAQEQTRLDALVHDEVMSTLFYASRGDAGLDDSVRTQALHALAQLERLRSGRDDSATPVSPELLATRLRSLVLAASTAIEFTVNGSRDENVPAAVAAAFAEATAEAARNSIAHAPSADRFVTLTFDDRLVRVEVRDTGAGFDPNLVSSHRLGIQVSIRGRMAMLPGGAAEIDSRPGRGTVVTLEWSDS